MASKRCVRRRNCQGKVHHDNLDFAEKALANAPYEGVEIYKCPYCGRGYVLGHRKGFRAEVTKHTRRKES